LEDIDPTSEWVEESHPPEFDLDFDINDLESEGIGLDPNPLVGDGVERGMAHASSSRATRPSCASTSTTTIVVANVNENSEFEESEDSELEDDSATHAEDPISSNGDEFDD
jgi:hypothetical protein